LLAHPQGITLFRLAKKKHANLSGIGASLEPGRWNLKGQEAIYTSLNSSTTLLERFVHTPKDQIPKNLAKMTILLAGKWQLSEGNLINDRSEAIIHVFESLQSAQANVWNALAIGPSILGIAVPSVLDPQWNVVLYPGSPFFAAHVELKKVAPFRYDRRMFPEKTAAK
jgi:RES domain-containing protein